MADSPFDRASCEPAFDALRTYDRGSPRASLLPIDQAVTAALKDGKARAAMESRLLRALQSGGSAVAREFVCSKLALVGTAAAVPALAALSGDVQLSTAARNALQAIPGSAVPKALRKALRSAQGVARIGIINSLGARRDPAAVGALAGYLRDSDDRLAAAAAAALGEIGTPKAARVLRDHIQRTPETLRRKMADALLVCAGRLAQQGRQTDSRALLNLLLAPGQPAYIQQAAAVALSRTKDPRVQKRF